MSGINKRIISRKIPRIAILARKWLFITANRRCHEIIELAEKFTFSPHMSTLGTGSELPPELLVATGSKSRGIWRQRVLLRLKSFLKLLGADAGAEARFYSYKRNVMLPSTLVP